MPIDQNPSAQDPDARNVEVCTGAYNDEMLATFIDEVAPEANVTAYGFPGPLVVKGEGAPPVTPERHRLPDGREVLVSRFPATGGAKRPYVVVVAEALAPRSFLRPKG